MKTAGRYFLILILILPVAFRCSEKETAVPRLAGTWTITQATDDGVLHNEWIGTNLTFKQAEGADGGEYSMAATKHDSIWHSNGTWEYTTDKNVMMLDDEIPTTFFFDADDLEIAKLIYEPSMVPHDSLPNILPLNGNWIFKFKRKS